MRHFALFFALGLLVLASPRVQAHEFHYDTLLIAWMKLDKDFKYTEDQVTSYMKLYRPKVYKEVFLNEFKFTAALAETQTEMRKAVERFNLLEPFTFKTTLTLGKYNFEKNAFPVREMLDKNEWYPHSPINRGTFPFQLWVQFVNSDALGHLKMDKKAAEAFVEARIKASRRDYHVYVTLNFHITALVSQRVQFRAEILSATFYSDPERTRIIDRFEIPSKAKDAKGGQE